MRIVIYRCVYSGLTDFVVCLLAPRPCACASIVLFTMYVCMYVWTQVIDDALQLHGGYGYLKVVDKSMMMEWPGLTCGSG